MKNCKNLLNLLNIKILVQKLNQFSFFKNIKFHSKSKLEFFKFDLSVVSQFK